VLVTCTKRDTIVVREFVTGNDLPRIVAHRCIIEASIGKRIVQVIEASIEQHRGNIVQAIEATQEA
jgi:hypothetical protein